MRPLEGDVEDAEERQVSACKGVHTLQEVLENACEHPIAFANAPEDRDGS